VQVHIEGFEDEIRRIVHDELAAAGVADAWLTPAQAAACTGLAEGTLRNASARAGSGAGEPGHASVWRDDLARRK
jgi:hypothetical protein